jgi:CubicO group peptidase (beta-lactamase class C family)
VGALIEVVSGMALGDFMEERIFKPLGMKDTAFHVPDEKRSRLCEIYLWNGNELEAHGDEVMFFSQELPCQSGGGGLMSTVDDYMAFTNFMLNNGSINGTQLVKPETIQLMSRNQLDDDILDQFINSEKLGYGYGFGVRSLLIPELSGLKANVGEFGWDGAASTWTGIDPSSEVTAVFMLQLFPFCHFPAPREFQEIMFNAVSEFSKETSQV